MSRIFVRVSVVLGLAVLVLIMAAGVLADICGVNHHAGYEDHRQYRHNQS